MSGIRDRQSIVVVVLGLGLALVLFITLTGQSDGQNESGFDGPPAISFVGTELDPDSEQEWQPSAASRNPFIGPFASGTTGTDDFEEPDGADAEGGDDSGDAPAELENTPISPSELAPEQSFDDLADIGALPGSETE